MSGCGLPVALQNKFKLFPSATSSSDGAVTISGVTTEEQINWLHPSEKDNSKNV